MAKKFQIIDSDNLSISIDQNEKMKLAVFEEWMNLLRSKFKFDHAAFSKHICKFCWNFGSFWSQWNEGFSWLETSPNTCYYFCNTELLYLSIVVLKWKVAPFCKKKIQNQMNRERIRMDVYGFKFNIKIASFDSDKKPLYESFPPFFRLLYFHIELYKHKFILIL